METYFKDRMPVFGFIDMPKANAVGSNNEPGVNPSFINPDIYQMYKDAGFNVVVPTYQREPHETIDVHREVEICNELGLGYLIRDMDFFCDSKYGKETSKSQSQFKDILQEKWYLSQPCIYGIQTKDEPTMYDFEEMGNFYRALYEFNETKWGFTTIFPSYANATQLGVTDLVQEMSLWDAYKIYAKTFLEKTNASYILYDHYFRSSLTINDTFSLMRSLSFYSNLSMDAQCAFMCAIEAIPSHQADYKTRWTVNMSLAYGCKGLEYYTYWPTIGGTTSMSSWEKPSRGGLVSANGIPHDSYYYVTEINKNVHTVDKYLMDSSFRGIQYFGNQTVYIEESDKLNESDCLMDVTGGDAFVGVFDYNGKHLYYVVNNSFDSGNQPFVAKFRKKCNLHLLNSKCDKTVENSYAAGFTLSGGEAILIEVDY